MNSLEKQRNDGQSVFVLSDGQTLQVVYSVIRYHRSRLILNVDTSQ